MVKVKSILECLCVLVIMVCCVISTFCIYLDVSDKPCPNCGRCLNPPVEEPFKQSIPSPIVDDPIEQVY